MSDQPKSQFQKRWAKFRTLRRGYYAFRILTVLYVITFANAILINNRAIVVKYDGSLHFPALSSTVYMGKDLGQRILGEADYRALKKQYEAEDEGNWVLMPPYPFGPNESLLLEPDLIDSQPPHPPSRHHWMGTDDRGRDVFARLAYGFRISITFALCVTTMAYLVGSMIGMIFGYFGGKIDFFGLRFVEMWSAIPFLYTVMIVASIVRPSAMIFALILAAFGWVGICYYMRGESYREKARDYVAAAVAQGEGNLSIMLKHILPNSLTPMISFAPFAIVGNITALVSLDFLGFGLPPPTPSWGELVNQGLQNIYAWHLVFFPLGLMFLTLLMVVFIGEAIREAFDPKVFSRLR